MFIFSLKFLGGGGSSDAGALFRSATGFGLMSDWLGCFFCSGGVLVGPNGVYWCKIVIMVVVGNYYVPGSL